jgi:carboxymethylenebutenolidase
VIPELKAGLAKTDVANTVKVFDGTHHGFCFAERAVYDPVASEQTWADIFAMFKRRLG